jgi:hypothetical protein
VHLVNEPYMFFKYQLHLTLVGDSICGRRGCDFCDSRWCTHMDHMRSFFMVYAQSNSLFMNFGWKYEFNPYSGVDAFNDACIV